MELVISQTSAKASLGLEDVFELTHPSTQPLLNVLNRPCPKAGQKDKILTFLHDLKAALTGLLGRAEVAQLHAALPLGSPRAQSGSGSAAATAAAADSGPGPEHSFPLLRRATTARLVQMWLRHRDDWRDPGRSERSGWAAEAVAAVGEVLLQLFLLHRSGMMAREVLEFLHVSKAAGTSMCHLAGAVGCHALDFGMGRTCLLREFDDQPRWLNGSHHWAAIAPRTRPHAAHPNGFLMYGLPRSPNKRRTCQERLKLMRKMRLDFFANEYTVYNELILINKTAPLPVGLRPPAAPPTPPEDPGVALRRAAGRYQQYILQLTAEGREGTGPNGGGKGSPRSAAAVASGLERRSVRQSAEASRSTDAATAAAAAASISAFSLEGCSARSLLGSGSYSAVVRGSHLCPRFANVAVLREPSRRFLSHMAFIATTYASHFEWPSIAEAFAPGRVSLDWWRAFAPPVMDGYLLRTLAGEGAFSLPLGSLDRAPYMELARAVLAQYDVILVLEFDPGRMQLACNYGLGWNHSLSEFQLRNSSSSPSSSHSKAAAAESSLLHERVRQLLPQEGVMEALMKDAVVYDNELYRFGAVLAGLDDVVWRAAHDALGEPMPGLWTGDPRGPWPMGLPQCGYINGGTGPRHGSSS